MKANSSKKDCPNLPSSSRMQMPSGNGMGIKSIKSMVKGGTKTKMKQY